MRISDWSSDVCSSDLADSLRLATEAREVEIGFEDFVLRPMRLDLPCGAHLPELVEPATRAGRGEIGREETRELHRQRARPAPAPPCDPIAHRADNCEPVDAVMAAEALVFRGDQRVAHRSEEHTSELQ